MKFKVNNNLKERPIIFGLKDTNLIYLGGIFIISFSLAFMFSSFLHFSLGLGLLASLILTLMTFLYLRKIQQRPIDSDYYLDRYLSSLLQRKTFFGSYSNNKLFSRERKQKNNNGTFRYV